MPRLEGLHGQALVLLYLTIVPASIFNGLVTAIMGTDPLVEAIAGHFAIGTALNAAFLLWIAPRKRQS